MTPSALSPWPFVQGLLYSYVFSPIVIRSCRCTNPPKRKVHTEPGKAGHKFWDFVNERLETVKAVVKGDAEALQKYVQKRLENEEYAGGKGDSQAEKGAEEESSTPKGERDSDGDYEMDASAKKPKEVESLYPALPTEVKAG